MNSSARARSIDRARQDCDKSGRARVDLNDAGQTKAMQTDHDGAGQVGSAWANRVNASQSGRRR